MVKTIKGIKIEKIMGAISEEYIRGAYDTITKAVCGSTTTGPVMEALAGVTGKTPRMFYLEEIKELSSLPPAAPSAATGGAPKSPFLYSGPQKPIL